MIIKLSPEINQNADKWLYKMNDISKRMINAKTSIIHTQDITTIKTLVCADISIPPATI